MVGYQETRVVISCTCSGYQPCSPELQHKATKRKRENNKLILENVQNRKEKSEGKRVE